MADRSERARAVRMWLRQALSVVLLPGTMAILVPIWIARREGVVLLWPDGGLEWLAVLVGVAAIAAGLFLFVGSLRRFASEGKGTLAPWDPPRHLVVHGLYRYVRNPMISGVLFVLVGQALVLRSISHAWWALIFLAMNATYIPLVEEPMLEARFGDEYREYRAHVPGLLPRLTPWVKPGSENGHAISPEELAAAIDRGAALTVLDVRSRAEFERGHVPGARNVPFWSARELGGAADDRSRPVVVYCGHGPRAALAAHNLRRQGYSQVRVLRGHMAGWRRKKLVIEE